MLTEDANVTSTETDTKSDSPRMETKSEHFPNAVPGFPGLGLVLLAGEHGTGGPPHAPCSPEGTSACTTGTGGLRNGLQVGGALCHPGPLGGGKRQQIGERKISARATQTPFLMGSAFLRTQLMWDPKARERNTAGQGAV